MLALPLVVLRLTIGPLTPVHRVVVCSCVLAMMVPSCYLAR